MRSTVSSVSGSSLGTQLTQLLCAEDMEPGSELSYQLAKTLFLYHPLGAKIAEEPIAMAQFKPREIAVTDGPEEACKRAFLDEWKRIQADRIIFNLGRLSRVYGISTLGLMTEDVGLDKPLNFKTLAEQVISLNVYDPLNTAGSLVLSQTADQMDFLKTQGVSVSGKAFHRSRCVILMNEDPVFLGYTTSAFGYVGRSAYQRALFPLKSYVQTMLTDDMLSAKAGVLIAKMKQPGSIVSNLMAGAASIKRAFVQIAMTGNVISIQPDEDIESLNLQHAIESNVGARKDILENIAAAVPMPAKLLNQETFAEGFGEGSEDAKHVAGYVDHIRIWLQPAYDFMDKVVQYRAWNADFWRTIQKRYPEYAAGKTHEQAFWEWRNSFSAEWPSLLTEPESELIKTDDVVLKAAIALYEVVAPGADPDNKARMVQWLADVVNERKRLFSSPLELDYEALARYEPPTPALTEPKPEAPFSSKDSDDIRGMLQELLRNRQQLVRVK